MVERRAARLGYYFASAAALLLGLVAVARLPGISSLPAGVSPAAISYPARIATVEVGTAAEIRFLAQSRRPGSVLEIRSDRGTVRARLVRQISDLHFFIVLLEGLLFFAVNLIVFCPRVERRAVRDLYGSTLLYGLAVLIGGVYLPRGPDWIGWTLPFLWLGSLSVLPLLFVHLALSFPNRSPLLDERPWITKALGGAAVVLFAWQAIAHLRYFMAPEPSAWGAVALSRRVAEWVLVIGVAAGCGILYARNRRLELSREKKQTKWLLWGFTIGIAPYVFLRTLPRLAGFESPLPPEVDRLGEFAIPLAFTLAVVREQLLDIDVIIRRSLIYGILAGVLAAAYLLAGLFLGERLAARLPAYAGLIRVVTVAIPVVLFSPTRRWIGQWVDRTFFRIRYDFARALNQMNARIETASNQEEVAEECLRFLEEQLLLRTAIAVVRRKDRLVIAGESDAAEGAALYEGLEDRLDRARPMLAAPNSTSRPDLEAADFPEPLESMGLRLAVPLRSDGRLIGAFFIGEKGTERRFVEEDLKLIQGVREAAVAALERIDLVQIAAERTLEREQAVALERMKSDFLARVAHDLRTPLTSIRYTVRNLLDGIGGTPSAGQVARLEAIQTASTQLGRLVESLLRLSRMEQPGGPGPLGPVRVPDVAREAVATLEPLAAEREIRLELEVEAGLGAVRGEPAMLHEVVANLVENAIRYSPDRSAVRILVRSSSLDGQTLVVEDRGAGIPADQLDRIFERYWQGRASDHARPQGFGLGLFIVRSYLEWMGGTVFAENLPDGGARFVCTLASWEDAGGELS